MCKLIAYTPKTAKSAQATVTISIDKVNDTDIILPSGTQITTQDDLVFETQSDAVIKAGDLSVDVIAVDFKHFE